ncbi:unnamed protein product, partial [Vitis vinifera]|uniref:Uncharacterized protein n=1 Tax=Vitis vinifera TaxID=29760 RepID=D7SHS7_VITVI
MIAIPLMNIYIYIFLFKQSLKLDFWKSTKMILIKFFTNRQHRRRNTTPRNWI